MRYYSTNHSAPEVSLAEAVIQGLAPDRGLYMPERIGRLPDSFFEGIGSKGFVEISQVVAEGMFGDDIDRRDLDRIVGEAFDFEVPVVKVEEGIYSLELFHGPTLAFKDVGARFMARMLSYFISRGGDRRHVTVLVATSGDTGSAVANGFLGVEGIDVVVLYPRGQVSEIQEKQFTTLGRNITALEIDSTFDDCQRLVKSAFMDAELNAKMKLTSANSINIARFMPQAFYYFNGYAQLKRMGVEGDIVVSVPSGNFGNLTAGLVAKRMGLPIRRFIAANNSNDVFLKYLNTGKYDPRPSVPTLANAMDVGDPSNFARILDLYGHSHKAIVDDISGARYGDDQIRKVVADTYKRTGYLLEPHGACGYQALRDSMKDGETGMFLETAHPAKFIENVEAITGDRIEIPERLAEFMKSRKQSVELSSDFKDFKDFLFEKSRKS